MYIYNIFNNQVFSAFNKYEYFYEQDFEKKKQSSAGHPENEL